MVLQGYIRYIMHLNSLTVIYSYHGTHYSGLRNDPTQALLTIIRMDKVAPEH